MEQKDRSPVEKEEKAKDEANMTNAKEKTKIQSEDKAAEKEGEKHDLKEKDKEIKKVTDKEKCSPERVIKKEKDAEEKREGSAKKKPINSFFGEHCLRYSLIIRRICHHIMTHCPFHLKHPEKLQ